MNSSHLAEHCAIVVFVASLATTGTAATITLTDVPGGTLWFDHPGPGGPPTASGAGQISERVLFDTSLGTLTEASLEGMSTIGMTKTLVLEPGTYFWLAWATFEISSPGRGVLSYQDLVYTGVGQDTLLTAGPFSFVDSNNRIPRVKTTENLDLFVNGGILELRTTAYMRISNLDTGEILYDGLADELRGSSRMIDIATYTYTPIPEPRTALLVGLGLALLGTARSARDETGIRGDRCSVSFSGNCHGQ